jgi:cell wall assembly regulator SMI1
MGYRSISIEEMQRRFEIYDGERNSRKHLDFSRRDSKARLHVCLSSWDELDKISEAYRELARRVGDSKEEKRDFKNNDRDIVNSIPKFLNAAKGGNQF